MGLAADHRRRRDHAAPRHHPEQGVRGTRVVPRHRGRRRLGRVRGQLLLDPRDPQREEPLRLDLVLHLDDPDDRGPLPRQQPVVAGHRHEELRRVRRCAGRADAVVVRPQRGRLLPDDADPRDHVLLPAEGGGAAGVQLPAVDRALLGAGVHLHLGWPAPPAEHRTARLGAVAGHAVQPDAVGAVVGRHAERPADAARRLAQGAHRSGAEVLRGRRDVLRHGDLRGPAAVDQGGLGTRSLHRLDHRPRAQWRARLERLHGRGHVLLARAEAVRYQAPQPEDGRLALLDRHLRHHALRRVDVGQWHQPGPPTGRCSTRIGTRSSTASS